MIYSDIKKPLENLARSGALIVTNERGSNMGSLALAFNDVQFDVIDQQSQPWLRLHQIGVALGYSRADAVNKVYQSNADEFTDSMTALVELDTAGGKQQVRVFSLRGCHLLAMFARTKIAKEFRKWVLDILDTMTAQVSQPVLAAERISPEQAGVLYDIVASRSSADGKLRAQMWGRLKKHFKYASYHDLLAVHFDEACQFLRSMDIKANAALPAPTGNEFDLLAADTANKVMDYYGGLHAEIKRLGGKPPEYPEFDKETIVRATVTRMMDSSRMLLTLDPQSGKPSVSFIPNNSWILRSDNIAKIVGDPDGVPKQLLPDIMQAAMKRIM